MELIYSNFDGLEISFQGAFPETILKQLERGRNEAEQNRRNSLVYLGVKEIPVQVAETGARGGFRYRFDTGLDRETWFVARSTNPEQWNIRVSVKSMALALHGYSGVKDNIIQTLIDLGAYGYDKINDITGEIDDFPKERISRFDVCFDFVTEDFIPDPNHLITHNRTKRKLLFSNNKEGELIFSGNNLIYLRIGSMPNRQLVFYNKIKEIAELNKIYWYKVWNINKKEFNKKIWRIEARAGKKELNKWNLRTFKDFEKKAGDVIISILEENRYVIPNKDKNRSRWPLAPFWKTAIKNANQNFDNYISKAKREEIVIATRKELQERYKKHLMGMAAPLSVALGHEDIDQIPGVLDGVKQDLEDIRKNQSHILKKKMKKAQDRLVFLDEKKSEN